MRRLTDFQAEVLWAIVCDPPRTPKLTPIHATGPNPLAWHEGRGSIMTPSEAEAARVLRARGFVTTSWHGAQHGWKAHPSALPALRLHYTGRTSAATEPDTATELPLADARPHPGNGADAADHGGLPKC